MKSLADDANPGRSRSRAVTPLPPPPVVDTPPVFESDDGGSPDFEDDATALIPVFDDTGGMDPMASADLAPPPAVPPSPPPVAPTAAPQPEWLRSSRPVDLGRPPSGAPSAFGGIPVTGAPAPAPLPPPAAPPAGPASLRAPHAPTVAPPQRVATGPYPVPPPSGGLGSKILIFGATLLGAMATGALSVHFLLGDEPPKPSVAPTGPSAADVPTQPPPSPLPMLEIPDGLPVEFTLVDDSTGSGLQGLTTSLQNAVAKKLAGDPRLMSGDAPGEGGEAAAGADGNGAAPAVATAGYSAALWVVSVSMASDTGRSKASAACSMTMTPTQGGEATMLKAKGEAEHEGAAIDAPALAREAVSTCGVALADAFLTAAPPPGPPDVAPPPTGATEAAAASASTAEPEQKLEKKKPTKRKKRRARRRRARRRK